MQQLPQRQLSQLPPHKVSVDDIETEAADLPPFRTDLGDLAGLKASIQKFGLLLVPPVVWRSGVEGAYRWVVIDGARRVKALQELKSDAESRGDGFPLSTIDVVFFAGAVEDARTLSALVHLSPVEPASFDLAVACDELLRSGMSQTAVARLSCRTQGWASQCATIVKGLGKLLGRVRASTSITWSEALHVASLLTEGGEPVRQATMLDELEAGHAQPRNKPLRGRAAAKASGESRG